ncbi:thioesterase II family protein [Streptomyces sp. NPDC053474]|uniref:thioesterase II family protein n=1 Tax=Streptomyces sp. NPDC053474 TaxID=3365704 RepID=UPI0037D22CF2
MTIEPRTTTPRAEDTAARWLRRPQPRPAARTTLVCFPHAGGTASFFTPWAPLLPQHVELVALQYPGRQDRLGERPIATMADLANAVAEVLRTGIRADRELILFGHSMGAALAWETALRLEAGTGPAPRRLFVSGHEGPSRKRRGTVHLLPEEQFVGKMKELGGTDPRLLDEPELREMVLPAVRADYRLIETYRPDLGARLRCPIGVFTGDQDSEVTTRDAEAWREASLGGDFFTRVFPGDHFYLADHAARIVAEMFGARSDAGHGQV